MLVQCSVLDNKLAVTNLLTGLESALTQSHPCLKFIKVDSILPEQKEEILLVTLTLLALHIPIIFTSHLVLIFLSLCVLFILSKVSLSFLQSVIGWEEVGDKLFTRLVHHTSDHGL